MACRTGCLTKDHESYSACLRDAGVRVAYANTAGGWDLTTQKKWDRELDNYRSAVAQGIQPDGTSQKKIDAAVAASDAIGTAYRADL